MNNKKYGVFAAVSLTTLLTACGSVETTPSGTTGSGGSGSNTSGGMTGSSTGSGVACMPPQQACGDVCVDMSGDMANCGSCGHGCQGGVCVGSRCQPVTLATEQYQVYQIAVNSSGVYWGLEPMKSPQNTSVVMLPSAGGALIPLASGLSSDLGGLAADEKNIYWAQASNIVAVAVGGGNVKILGTATKPIPSMAIYGTNIYWADQYVGLYKLSVGGGSPVQVLAANNESFDVLAVNATRLFWISPVVGLSEIKTVSVAGGPVTTLASGIDVGKLVADEKNVYWVGQSNKQISVVPVGGGPVKVLGMTPYPTEGIAQDDDNLYFSGSDAMGAIIKQAKAGGDPQVIASGHGTTWSLAVDATSVYWAGNDGMVLKVAK